MYGFARLLVQLQRCSGPGFLEKAGRSTAIRTLLKTSRFWEENDSIGGGVILGEASCHNQVFGILKIGFVG